MQHVTNLLACALLSRSDTAVAAMEVAASRHIVRALATGRPVPDCLLALLTRDAARGKGRPTAKPLLDALTATHRREPGRVLLQLLAWSDPPSLGPMHLALQLLAHPAQGPMDADEAASAAIMFAQDSPNLDTRLRAIALQRIEASVLASAAFGDAANIVMTVQRGLQKNTEATRSLSSRLLQRQQNVPTAAPSQTAPITAPPPDDMHLAQVLSLGPPSPPHLPPRSLTGPATNATIIADPTPLDPNGGHALGVVLAFLPLDADGVVGWWSRNDTHASLVATDLVCASPWSSWRFDASVSRASEPKGDALVEDRIFALGAKAWFDIDVTGGQGGAGPVATAATADAVAGGAAGMQGSNGTAGMPGRYCTTEYCDCDGSKGGAGRSGGRGGFGGAGGNGGAGEPGGVGG